MTDSERHFATRDRLTRSSQGAAPNPILGGPSGRKAIGLVAGSLLVAGLAFAGGYFFADAAGDAKADVLRAELTSARTELQATEKQLTAAEKDYAYLSEWVSRVQDAAASAARAAGQSSAATREVENDSDEDDGDERDDDRMTEEQEWLWNHRSGVDGPIGIDSQVQDDHPKPSYSDCATRAFYEEQCAPGWNG